MSDRDPALGPYLALLPEENDDELAALPPSIQAQLDAVPLHIQIDDSVNLDGELDPAETDDGKRRCIAIRKAGGRCTVKPPHDDILCTAHSGRLDPRKGGEAKAEKARLAQTSAEERSRLARLGARGVIADTFAQNALKLRATVQVLLDAAALGDLASAKLIGPYLNQGLGMPTEVQLVVTPTTADELDSMDTAALQALVDERRAALQTAS